MNDSEHNFERLIRAGLGKAARPSPAARELVLRRLKTELRQQIDTVARPATPERDGQVALKPSFVETTHRRSRQEQNNKNSESRRETIMSKLMTRWGFGLSAAAAASAAIIIIGLVAPKTSRAAEIMAKGARALANLSSVHLRGQLRTAPNDNFSAIMPAQDFVSIELWKEFSAQPKWRVEKPGRIAVMDGQSTVLFIKPDFALKAPPTRTAFDTDWLHQMADLSQTLNQELLAIKAHGWPVTLTQEQGPDGKAKSVVAVEAKSGLPDSDYLKNSFFMTADTRRVYVFDNQSELLESVKIYLHAASGDQLVFELNEIEYNQPIAASVFQLQLPANVKWQQEMQTLPDNAKYAAMTPEVAARTFLEACGREDWTEAEKFLSPLGDSFKQARGGIQVLKIGPAFTSAISKINGAQFVPYEIKQKNGQVVKHNLALKKHPKTGRWFVDGGI